MPDSTERCFTGYCRAQDQSRLVLCEYETAPAGPRLLEAGCAYPDCPYAAGCVIAAEFTV